MEVYSVVRGDDLVLIGVGIALMVFSRFVAKMRLAFYFGLGFVMAIVTDELVELALGPEA